MRSFFDIGHGMLLLLLVTTMMIANPCVAQALKSSESDSQSIEEPLKTSAIDDERSLQNNDNAYRQWMNYNNNGGYYRNNNYNNQRNNNYMGNRYYGNFGYYGRNYKNYNKYYNGNMENNNPGDDRVENENEQENEVDDAGNNDDDASYDDDGAFSTVIPSELEEKFWQWYESPPSQWTAAQWAWFSGILVTTVGFMFCCCVGCANICAEGSDRACSSKEQEFEDYTSLENGKRGSFMTINTNVSDGTCSVDDDATYDSIIRMRSST